MRSSARLAEPPGAAKRLTRLPDEMIPISQQLDRKCSTFPQSFAARGNRASMHLNDRFTNGKTKSKAFVARIDLLKDIEYLVEKFGFDPDAAVADLDGHYVGCPVA